MSVPMRAWKRRRSSVRSAIASVSADARIDASGLRSSCDTSAAKRSVKRRCASSRAGQLLQRPRQLADLVAAGGAAEGAQAASVVIDQRLGVVAELPQRAHDGHRADDGEGERDGQRDDHDLEHPQPHVVQPLQDPERRLRDEHDVADASVTRDRPGAVERHRSLTAGRQAGRWRRSRRRRRGRLRAP